MKRMLTCLAVLCALLAGCAGANAELTVVCSLFPQYDFTRVIGGEHVSVTQLLPLGVDSHEYEPSAREMIQTDAADLFIYTDSELEGWVESLSGGLTHVRMVRAADGIDLVALNEEWEAASAAHAHEEHDHAHEHAYDAHIWLDPTLAMRMCENIRDALCEADPAHAEEYQKNCDAYIEALRALDADIQSALAPYPDATLYFGGKFAYSHFLRHYGIHFESAYSSCSDEGEPGARVIVEMVDEMRESGAKAIFTDEMSNGEVARAIAEQAGAEVCLFHTAHNLSRQDAESGRTYLDIMYANLENIRGALS